MDTIAELINHPERLNKDTLYGLRELVAKYPYYQVARLLFLKNLFLLHDPSFGEELRRAALYLPDRRVLFKMVEGANYEIQPTPLHKEEERAPEGDRTQSLIDDFLRTTASDDAPQSPHRKPTAADAQNPLKKKTKKPLLTAVLNSSTTLSKTSLIAFNYRNNLSIRPR